MTYRGVRKPGNNFLALNSVNFPRKEISENFGTPRDVLFSGSEDIIGDYLSRANLRLSHMLTLKNEFGGIYTRECAHL